MTAIRPAGWRPVVWQDARGKVLAIAVVTAIISLMLGLQAWVYWPGPDPAPHSVEGRVQLRLSDNHRFIKSLHVVHGLDVVEFDCPYRRSSLVSARADIVRFLTFQLFKQGFPCGSAGWLSGALGQQQVRVGYDTIWRPFGSGARLLSVEHKGHVLFGPDRIREGILDTLRAVAFVLFPTAFTLLGVMEWDCRRRRARRARLLTGRI